MNTELIMKSDVLDILFEKRNKLYGAYTLRKFYPERIKKSLAIIMGIVFLFCIAALMPKQTLVQEVFTVIDDHTLGNIPPEKKPAVKPAPPPAAKQNVATAKWTSTPTIVNEKDTADILHNNFENLQIGSTDILSIPDGPSLSTVGESVTATQFAKTEVKEPDPKIPIDNPEVEPAYPGGINALRVFLERNLSNPKDLDEGEQVSVKIKFIVGYDGALKSFETVQDGGKEFNNEVVRVLKKMPQWVPGKSNGKNVSVYYTIPVKFMSRD